MLNWWRMSLEVAAANMEAQRVIALRLAKLAKGGPAANQEARRMIAEKVAASTESAMELAAGGSALSVIRRYRTIMRANQRRLDGGR